MELFQVVTKRYQRFVDTARPTLYCALQKFRPLIPIYYLIEF